MRNLPQNNCADVLQNTALLSYTDATGAASSAVTSTHAITLREPDATLSKTIAPASGAGRGDVLTVTLTFGNDGPSPLYDAVLTDVLPIWISYRGVVGDTPSPTVSGRVLTWTIASITPGERQVVIFTVQMADDAPLDHVDDILGDVRGVVGDAFEMPRDTQQLDKGLGILRMCCQLRLSTCKHLTVHGVDFIVGQ